MEDEHVMAKLTQQAEAALNIVGVDQQIRDENHHSATRVRFGGAGEDIVDFRFIARFASFESANDRGQMARARAEWNYLTDRLVKNSAANSVLLAKEQVSKCGGGG